MTSTTDFFDVSDQNAFFDRLHHLSEERSIAQLWSALETKSEFGSPEILLACADIAMCAGDRTAAFTRYREWSRTREEASAFLPFTRSRISAQRVMGPVIPNCFDLAKESDPIVKLVGVGALFSLGNWPLLDTVCNETCMLDQTDWKIMAAMGFAKASIYDYTNAAAFFIPALLQGHGSAIPHNGRNVSVAQAAEECASLSRKYTVTGRVAEKSLISRGFKAKQTGASIDATKIDIFIKTCAKDEEFFVQCLKSIDIFASGFRRVVIVTDEDHDYHFDMQYDHVVHRVAVPDAPETFSMPAGYRMQMVVKLSWMDYTDADAVVITDSDTILTRAFTPQDMLRNGKPVWTFGEWHEGIVWRAASELVIGAPMPSCCMREHPFIFTRDATTGFLDYIDQRFGCSICDLFFADKIPGRFCEFEILGGYIRHIASHGYEVLPHKYTGIVRQYWSWGGFTEEVKANIAEHLSARPVVA